MNEILDFWFGPSRIEHRSGLWWNGKLRSENLQLNSIEETDQYISNKWKHLLDSFLENGLSDDHPWVKDIDGKMALLLLFDQFARNIYRGRPEAFHFTDQFGVQLAQEILAQSEKIHYTYRLFCYVCLMHTEKILNVIEAHLGIINLARMNPDELISLKIHSMANECKKHHQLLIKYGRYPHRNKILGRENKPEEVIYLNSESLPSWVKSVKNYRPEKKKKPLRILVLHSNLQSGSSFRLKTRSKLEKGLEEIAELVYVNAPHVHKKANFTWWTATDDPETMVYNGLEGSIKYINHLFNLDQFDGIIGFSQGGTLAGIIANLIANSDQMVKMIKVKFIVIISGFYCRDVRERFHSGITWDQDHQEDQVMVEKGRIKGVPSFQIWGSNDILVDSWRSAKLAEMFEQVKIHIHDGGHFVPNKWPVGDLKIWLDQFVTDEQFSLRKIVVDNKVNLDQLDCIQPETIDELVRQLLISSYPSEVMLKVLKHVYPDEIKARLTKVLDNHVWKGLIDADSLSFHKNKVACEEFRTLLIEMMVDQLLLDYSVNQPSQLALVVPKKNNLYKSTGLFYSLCSAIGQRINIYAEQGAISSGLSSNDKKTIAIHFKRFIKKIVKKLEATDTEEEKRPPTIKFLSIAEGLKEPISKHITHPEPVPLDLAPVEQQKELYTFLHDRDNQKLGQDLTFDSGFLFKQPARLDLCKRAIGPEGVGPLMDSLKFDSIVRNNPLIEHLLLGNNLCGNGLGQQVGDFIKSGKSKLKTWYIAGNHLDAQGIKPVCQALEKDNYVEQLWLKRNPICFSGAKILNQMLQTNRHLQVLDVANSGLMDAGASVIIEAIPLNLKVLYLSSNGLGIDTCRTMMENGDRFRNLDHLGLDCNRLTDQGAEMIASVLSRPDCGLKVLGLESCAIGPAGAQFLASALMTNLQLISFRLGMAKATRDLGEVPNRIESSGTIAISRMLRVNQVLRKVDLTYNNIKQDAISDLAETMSYHNKSLLYLNLEQYGVPYNELCRESINVSLKRNRLMIQNYQEVNYYLEPPHIKEILSISRISEE